MCTVILDFLRPRSMRSLKRRSMHPAKALVSGLVAWLALLVGCSTKPLVSAKAIEQLDLPGIWRNQASTMTISCSGDFSLETQLKLQVSGEAPIDGDGHIIEISERTFVVETQAGQKSYIVDRWPAK